MTSRGRSSCSPPANGCIKFQLNFLDSASFQKNFHMELLGFKTSAQILTESSAVNQTLTTATCGVPSCWDWLAELREKPRMKTAACKRLGSQMVKK